MNFYIGQKIKIAINDFAEIIGIHGDNIKLLYKGKKYVLNIFNRKLSILNNKIDNKTDIKNNINECCKSCKNCLEMKKGNCFGYQSSICSDYRPSPEISRDEINRWPKLGDASYYRIHSCFKS